MTDTSIMVHNLQIRFEYKTSKTDIQLCIIDIDEQLKELYKELAGYPSPLRYRIARIRNNFFRLSEFTEGCDIVKFAIHEPGERTPVDWFWRQQQQDKKKSSGGCACHC